MPELTRTQTISRNAWLELREELRLVNDGYEFLDEKRILLAAELLRQRDAYRAARASFVRLHEAAATALADAAGDHGLDGLQVHPAAESTDARVNLERRACVGQTMLEASFAGGEGVTAQRSGPTVRICESAYRELLAAGAALAALSANLTRLTHEYRRTERRVRALENVVLPEIRDDLAVMEEHLELLEQEEVIRVRSGREERF